MKLIKQKKEKDTNMEKILELRAELEEKKESDKRALFYQAMLELHSSLKVLQSALICDYNPPELTDIENLVEILALRQKELLIQYKKLFG